MSGLDLWHGGRALREKKKEEKASAVATQDSTLRDTDPADWPFNGVAGSGTQSAFIGPASLGSTGGGVFSGEAALREALQGFGLHNMTPEDVWEFLKAKLLVLFEGEDVRIALEESLLDEIARFRIAQRQRGKLRVLFRTEFFLDELAQGVVRNVRQSFR